MYIHANFRKSLIFGVVVDKWFSFGPMYYVTVCTLANIFKIIYVW
jgi:hypothetical protein